MDPHPSPTGVLFGADGDVVIDACEGGDVDGACGSVVDGDVWRLDGELDASAVRAAWRPVRTAAVRGVDLRGLTRLDGAGLQLLLWCARAQDARGGPLTFVGASPDVARALALCGLDAEEVA